MIPCDTILAKDGSQILFRFFAHASIGIEWNNLHIYIDPVGTRYNVDFSAAPKADMIFITHNHQDHFDTCAIDLLRKKDSLICASKQCFPRLSCRIPHTYTRYTYRGVLFYAFPAYNTTETNLCYHPIDAGGIGFVINLGGTNILFAGDTEDTIDICSLQNVDVAFLPVNQPYTMTIQQVCNVVEKIHPTVLYPYHTGSKYGQTDVRPLKESLKGKCDIRIFIYN